MYQSLEKQTCYGAENKGLGKMSLALNPAQILHSRGERRVQGHATPARARQGSRARHACTDCRSTGAMAPQARGTATAHALSLVASGAPKRTPGVPAAGQGRLVPREVHGTQEAASVSQLVLNGPLRRRGPHCVCGSHRHGLSRVFPPPPRASPVCRAHGTTAELQFTKRVPRARPCNVPHVHRLSDPAPTPVRR